MSIIPDPVSTYLQPRAPDVPHRRCPSCLPYNPADREGEEMGNSGVERRPAVPADVGGVHGRDAADV